MRFWWIAAALCAASVPALAQDSAPEEKPITGTYYMGPAMDAEDPKAPADHIYMTLTGDVAKAMWDAMPGKEEADECVGRMVKWAKSLACYAGPSPQAGGTLAPGDSPYQCFMGVNLKAGALYLGQDC